MKVKVCNVAMSSPFGGGMGEVSFAFSAIGFYKNLCTWMPRNWGIRSGRARFWNSVSFVHVEWKAPTVEQRL